MISFPKISDILPINTSKPPKLKPLTVSDIMVALINQ